MMAGINMGAAAPGLGRLALAIGGGPQGAYQKGYDNELSLQSKLAQALATINASNATARLHGLQADEAQGQLDARKPEAVLGSALTAYGIPTDESSAVADFLKTGQLGGKYRPLPADQQGPTVPAPDWAGKLGAVARSVGTFNQAVALGDKSVENLAKAEGLRRGQGLSDAIIAGQQDPTRVAQAEYAVSGKAPYDFKEFGVGNQLTGQVDASGAPAQNFAQYRQGTAGAQKALATEHYAQAGAANALAKQRLERPAGGVAVNPDALLNDDDAKFMAQQYLRGDSSVLTNLGRGAQGAQNIVKLRKTIRAEAEAAGMTPAQVATAMAQFQGDKAAFRTAGTKGANIEMAAAEADQVADIALQASQAVPRTQFVPVNRALNAYRTNTGDPRVVQFGAATNALINTYARAISPSGTPTVHDKQHAEDILSSAQTPEQYAAVVGMMKREISAAKASPGQVRESLAGRVSGTTARAPAPAASGGFRYLGKE